MLNRTRLLLYVNVALFIYSLSEMIKILLVHNNFFSQFFNNLSSNLKSLTDKISSAITSWQSIIYLLIFVLLIFLLLKFWRVTFILLEIILALLIIDYVLLFVQHQVGFENLFIIAVMVVTLMNIWQTSKDSNLL
ncbi:hypothetical protein VN96_1303 [Lactococcus cremoris]|uniref:Uncharacterized protein n=3 Tax=Lactococcus lactis subsp. cremoris TaxID=1359 RepID=A0A1E7G347_LACLC|nr:hypothetical protein [Lactococcus cremoris]MCI1840538.1 hypothetical protein [Lactococcus lactis]KEY63777.1 hypothetical protein U725_00099 [Lactococcus cremoris subsp. cremoris GE214]KKW71297.1 hypothetical protein VN93_1776 [Lactococcus cremoris]KKW72360.1 hypothetical protein VN96_1303 [Lactococcus cremoris]KZK09602.1 hypothetical protein V4_1092 [Lactococcus cremoris]